eukprot:gene757-12051_t
MDGMRNALNRGLQQYAGVDTEIVFKMSAFVRHSPNQQECLRQGGGSITFHANHIALIS